MNRPDLSLPQEVEAAPACSMLLDCAGRKTVVASFRIRRDATLVTASGRQAEVDFERIVDEPLKGCQGPNHDDSHRETVPEACEANVTIDSAHRLSGGFASLTFRVQFADHDIRRMADYGACNTGNIAPQEADARLL